MYRYSEGDRFPSGHDGKITIGGEAEDLAPAFRKAYIAKHGPEALEKAS